MSHSGGVHRENHEDRSWPGADSRAEHRQPDACRCRTERGWKGRSGDPRPAVPSDSLSNPLADKQAELRQEAISDVLSGMATPRIVNGNLVAKTGREPSRRSGHQQDQYVELANERTDRVFTLLVEFGDQRHPDFPDVDVDPDTAGPTRYDGPLFNQIPKPGTDDNSTFWRENFSKDYYEELYFGDAPDGISLRQYYEKQSSGRYSVTGSVTDFVRVAYNEARYGRPFEGTLDGVGCTLADIVCSNTWALVGDGMNQWVEDQKAAGRTDAEDAGRPQDLRRPGPVRLRRRWQLR